VLLINKFEGKLKYLFSNLFTGVFMAADSAGTQPQIRRSLHDVSLAAHYGSVLFHFALCVFLSELEQGQGVFLPSFSGLTPPQKSIYLIPHFYGQGANNLFIEFQLYTILSKISNRRLCLTPFHRFYLDTSGRPWIPVEETFDVHRLQSFVKTSSLASCRHACGNQLDLVWNFASKQAPDKQYNRFGFQNVTGFRKFKKWVNMHQELQSWETVNDISKSLRKYQDLKCVSAYGGFSTVPLERTYMALLSHMTTSEYIVQSAKFVVKSLFHDDHYLAVHWRFEEQKCASKNLARYKLYGSGEACFYAGVWEPPHPWLRLISGAKISETINIMMTRYGIQHAYIATDGEKHEVFQAVKQQTGAKQVSDCMACKIPSENFLLSKVEQEICATSFLFLGTRLSSWTSLVMLQRTLHTPNNVDSYIDVLSCKCGPEGFPQPRPGTKYYLNLYLNHFSPAFSKVKPRGWPDHDQLLD